MPCSFGTEPQLSISTSSFTEFKRFNLIYADKTALISPWACNPGFYLLTRPRRFGKSLLVSTLETLFRNGLRDFRGLALESLWQDVTYRTVRLDFLHVKQFQTFPEFQSNLYQWLALESEPFGFHWKTTTEASFWTQWTRWLKSQSAKSLVLLIDEYDAPLCAVRGKPALSQAVTAELAQFYRSLAEAAEVFRLVFVTGITRFPGTAEFFTGFTDLSFEVSCGTLLGFTEDEVRRFYPTYLQKARAALHLSEDELLQRLVRHYGGYCFDEKREPGVMNPWSLLNFLQSPKRGFQPYWVETGGLVSGLRHCLTNPMLRDPAKFGETVTLSKSLLTAETTNESAGGSVLLTQTGYLTVKNFLNGNFEVGYPNREVADSMASLYSELLLSGKQLDDVDAGDIDAVLAEGTDDDVVEQFNRVFAALDYLNYPVTNESVCRGYLFVLLQGAQLYAKLEVHNAYGRSDLEVDAGDRHWVFELKFLAKTDGASNEKAAKLLAEAAEQMRSKHYGEEDRSGRDLKRLALVFSEEKRQFTAWQAV